MHRGEHAYVVLNLYPYGNGHLMIAAVPARRDAGRPRRRRARGGLGAARPLARRARRARSSAQATTSASTSARAAGAGIEDHLHLHVVPRWNGDNNFMPVLADVRVMPQHLAETRGSARSRRGPRDASIAAHDARSLGLQGLRRPRHRAGRARRRRRLPHRPRLRGRVRAAHDGDRPRHAADLAGAAARPPCEGALDAGSDVDDDRPRRHRDALLTRSASTATRAGSSSPPRTTRSSTTA